EHGKRARELDGDDGALRRVDVEIADRAGVDPGDAHVGALDDAERVVELDVVGVRVVRARARRHPRAGGGGEQDDDQGDPPHGPVGTSLGSHESAPLSVNGVEPSPGSRSFDPGQRWSWFVVKPGWVAGLTGSAVENGTTFGGSGAGRLSENAL